MKLLVFSLLLTSALAQISPRITTKGGIIGKGILDRNAATLSAPDDDDFFDINQRQNLDDLIDGDIKARGKEGYNGITNESLYWSSEIPVKYSTFLSNLAISGIEDARQEYEMRTCLKFTDLNGEPDYISFEPRSGCYSSVGRVGGGQTISIGSGCEKMSTIIHEIMHALGIYHEQSRTDRDDYITIMTENIDSDKLHNFNTYNYGKIDDKRVSYDYQSVMHYSDSGFSNNGEKTIVTIDPAYQDVIGQRRTFSPSDATLINRMYPCGDPLRHSYSCGFEESTACGYVQDTTDDIDWIRYDLANMDEKSLPSSFPNMETTLSKSGEGSFMMLDTSGKKAGDLAYMRSMRLKSSNTDVQCLEFSYYMDLAQDSDAALAVYLGSIDPLSGKVLSTEPIVTITGDHENYWNVERLNIQAPEKYKLVFVAKTSSDPSDIIALDDIHILDKPCETNYFVINDFANLLATTVKGDGFYSPLMYDDKGYAFKILFYPHGSTSAVDGYWSMFFAVAQGDNDDGLNWPYYDRVLKMKIVDQNAKVIERMGQYSQFVTSSSGGSWEQPTSSQNGAYGYSNFMPLSDILNTMEFVKNDRIVISVNVRDMTGFTRNHPARFGQLPSQQAVEPKQMSVQEEDHDFDDHKHSRDINVNVVMPENAKNQDDTVPMGTAVAAVIGCVVGVFLVMAMLMMCMNQSHQSSINAIAFASQKFGERKGKINEHYSMDKV